MIAKAQATPVAIRRGRELSPMQRGLWMSQRNAPDAPAQNMALLSHIDGPVDAGRLADAFAHVVGCSDVLRSRFREERGTPAVHLSSEPPRSTVVKLSRSDTARWAEERARRHIDLAEASYDSVIIEHDDGTVSWFLNLHHTITDATSSALVFDYTARAYHGETVEIPEYYAYVAGLGATSGDRARDHWRARPPAAHLGGLYQPHDDTETMAVRASLDVDETLGTAVEEALDGPYRLINSDLSWTALLTTVLAIHVHRVSGASAFAVGIPVHNRRTPEARRLLGPLMEVFPVDVELVAGESFGGLHRRVTKSLMTTLRHAHPGTAPNPDFQAIVNVIPRAPLESFGPYTATTSWIHPGAIDSGNLIRLQRTGYAEELVVDVNVGAASPGHRSRLPQHLRSILDAAVRDPDQPIDRASICTEEELTLIEAWEEGMPSPIPSDVSAMLRRGLATDDTVLVDGDRTWSGTELSTWIDGVARWLRAEGAGRGSRIGLCFDRSAEAVVAIAAVLEAGASYVPLDPAHPVERRTRLAARAGCSLVVGQLPSPADLAAVVPVEWPEPLPSDEAYLLFTSGSTGEPKGVPIAREGLSRYLEFAMSHYRDADEPVRAALFGSLTFDLTVTSLFLPLVTGGQLVVIADDGPAGLAAVARRQDLTWCKATPSHLEILVRLLPADHSIRTFVVGGEAFRADLADRLVAGDSTRVVFNEYGPTEAVVGCMIHRYDPSEDSVDVPIGVPMPGVSLRIVDDGAQRVPIGAPGELWVSSPGVTKGYLDQTEEDPFVELDGKRFYRTGDLARLLDNGAAVYLGRVDHQVKIGGIRLEPTEVEAALIEHPSVKSAAVRLWAPSYRPPSVHCARCGLPDNVPDVVFDDDGVCSTCRTFDAVAPVAASWFGDEDDLREIRDRSRARRSGDFDCLHLLSGGKDSTYALYRLVELGFEPYVLTLDNGFISDQAKANVERTISDLGLKHELATTPAMNEIFRDSLERHANVCHGCYKTIYTLATTRAVELGIPTIVTGLSRGQLFETRLIPQQFALDRFDPESIDRAVVQARRAYHRVEDAPRRLLDTTVFDSDDVFAQVDYVDIYRYLDVPLEEMLAFLDREAPWVRPSDTGRSTNCRVNDVGIHTHLLEEGFHNYAVPYAWDVRLGHKTRNEAMEELDDRLDPVDVGRMLSEIGYVPQTKSVLTAWFELEEGATAPSPAALRSHLGALLPQHAIPSAFVEVEELPIADSGKLNAAALPQPRMVNRGGPSLYVEARTATESAIVTAWERVLSVEPIGIDDDFFALGGDSLAALEMVISIGVSLDTLVPEDLAFTNSTPRRLAAAIEALEPELATAASADPPPPADPATAPVTSESELGMLFESRRTAGSARFNVGHLHRIDGRIDEERLRTAVLDVVPLHQPLTWTYGSVRTRLDASAATSFDIDDTPIDDAELAELAEAHHRAPFDLDEGPLLRVTTRRITDGTTAVLLAVHHVSADAAGLLALWKQIGQRYADGPDLRLETDYSGFVSWQADRITDADRAYWLDQADADARVLLAPPERPAADGFTRRVSSVSPKQLRGLPRVSGAAMALAGLGVVLAGRSEGDRLGVGVVTSTRSHPAANDLVGYLLNTVPHALSLPGAGHQSLSFANWCEQVSAEFAPALGHRVYPISRIVRDRRAAGRSAATPEVLFAFDELPDTTLGSIPSRHDVLFNGVAVGPLTVFVEVRSDRVDLSAEYQGDRFAEDDVESLLADLDDVLSRGVAQPSTSLAELASAVPSRSSLVGRPIDPDIDPLASIDHHLASGGGRTAVVCGRERLTWAELDQSSGSVAQRLRDSGVGPGDRVIVALPRTPDLISAIVGVMRAGASYVPIDPTYPEDRQRLIAEGAGAKAAIVEPGARRQLTADDIVPSGDREFDSDGLVPLAASPELEAYVIFTSGSTGRPRGVPVTRKRLGASTAARFVEYSAPAERFLLISSSAFDSSVAGLFWTLASGGTVVLPPDDVVNDVDGLLDTFDRERVTHTLMVPTLYRAILERGVERPAWPAVVVVAGERCTAPLVERHLELRPESMLFNEYGPTEATVWSTVHRCDEPIDPVPIGRPVAGTRVDVVDEHGDVVPPGVAGELRVCGPGVVDGYDDGSHASRFGSIASGDRFFLTGDRALIRGGSVLFLGRIDDQLNVGGVRLEPEEVERVISSAPGVRTVIVTATDLRGVDELIAAAPPAGLQRVFAALGKIDDPAAALRSSLLDLVEPDLVLVAHIEADSPGPDYDELHRHATELLPGSHRPRRFVVHDELPRTPNGKLDREAAASLVDGRVLGPSSADRHPTDQIPVLDDSADADAVSKVFADVLRLGLVRTTDSFFELGGHSVLALRLLDELEGRLGLTLSVAELYRDPTPNGIAMRAEATSTRRARGTQHLLEIQTQGTKPPLVGVHVLGRNGAFYRPLSEFLGDDQPVYGLGLAGAMPDDSTPRRLQELSLAYADELERAVPTGPVALAAVSVGAYAAVELAHRLEERGRQVLFVALFDATGPDADLAAISFSERLRLHGKAFRRQPLRYVGDRLESRWLVLQREAQRLEIAARGRLAVPLPDRLKVRSLVEQNVEDSRSHRPEPLVAPIVAFKAIDDVITERLAANGMGWAGFSYSSVEVFPVAGGHLSMLDSEHAHDVGSHLESVIERTARAAEARDAEALDRDVRLGLATRRLAATIGRWRSYDLDDETRALLGDVESAARAIAEDSREEASRIEASLLPATSKVTVVPPPALAAFSLIRLVSDEPVDEVPSVLSSLGYRSIGRGTSVWVDESGRHRVELLTDERPVDTRAPMAGSIGEPADLGLFIATPTAMIGPVLDLAEPTPEDLIVDLGCGDGRVLIEAVRRYGCKARGVEIDAQLATAAREATELAGLSESVEVIEGDANDPAALVDATIVFGFLPAEVIHELLPRVMERLGPDGRFVTHEQLMTRWPIEPTRSCLVIADGITVAWRWDAGPSDSSGRALSVRDD